MRQKPQWPASTIDSSSGRWQTRQMAPARSCRGSAGPLSPIHSSYRRRLSSPPSPLPSAGTPWPRCRGARRQKRFPTRRPRAWTRSVRQRLDRLPATYERQADRHHVGGLLQPLAFTRRVRRAVASRAKGDSPDLLTTGTKGNDEHRIVDPCSRDVSWLAVGVSVEEECRAGRVSPLPRRPHQTFGKSFAIHHVDHRADLALESLHQPFEISRVLETAVDQSLQGVPNRSEH